MAGALANQVQPPLKCISGEFSPSRNEYLLDMWGCLTRRGAQIGLIRIRGDDTPADEFLTLVCTNLVDGLFTTISLLGIRREKNDPSGELAGVWKLRAQIVFCDLVQEIVWKSRQDACAITGICFSAARSPMIHTAQQVVGITDDLMAWLTLDMSNKTHTTAVMLEARVI
jgi:hypothetical protein